LYPLLSEKSCSKRVAMPRNCEVHLLLCIAKLLLYLVNTFSHIGIFLAGLFLWAMLITPGFEDGEDFYRVLFTTMIKE
jgi:hypothetical protein